MKNLPACLHRSAFGVCEYLGQRMGLQSARVRVYFIYLSFVALGSPILVYLFLTFWLNIRQYVRRGRLSS